MSLPRYSSYKDSGVEWLGEVPSHWKVLALKYCLYSIISGITADQVEEGDDTVPVTRIETISGGIFNHERLGFIKRNDARLDKKLYRGDILFSNINSLNMIGNCAVYSEDAEIFAGMNLLVLRPCTGNNAKWLYYYVRSSIFRQTVESLSKPAINQASIPQSAVATIRICAPPTDEQTAIADFLNRETGKIDALVAEQERLIALLTEKRQAVISHAVTKGLNPTAPMKPSGIDWLGEIPAHWDIHKIKAFSTFTGGGTPSRDTPDFWNGDIPWVSPKDMKFEKIVGAEECITALGLAGSSSSLIPVGSLLMVVRSGILQHTIPVAINDIPVALNQDMKAIKFDLNICLPRFFMRWVQGLNDSLLLVWGKQGATVESIEHDYLARTAVPLPSPSEQQSIIQYLDAELAKFDELILNAKKAIILLQERRTALISAAVTGKIDVRGQTRKEQAA